MYFLTPDIINSDFVTVEDSGIKKYRLYGTKVLNSEKYLIKSKSKSKSNTLTRIENALALAFADFNPDYALENSFVSYY